MIKPQTHELERERLLALESYSIMDTFPEVEFDNITTIAAAICNMPISLVSLVDDKRQWFKSRHGLGAEETPKEYAFCGHAILEPDQLFMVQDARRDERFHDNPLVTSDPYVIFYAGMPLVGSEGLPLGTLCVIDNKPNLLSQSQITSLKALSNQVVSLMELRKKNQMLEKAQLALEEKNIELERFAFIAAHDLKSPLMGVASMANLLAEEHSKDLNPEALSMLNLIESSSDKLRRLIDGLLAYSRCDKILTETKSEIHLHYLKEEILALFVFENKFNLHLISDLTTISANKTAIDQVLINLVANAVKYNDKDEIHVDLNVHEDETHYHFYISDNGPGIEPEYQKLMFEIFEIIEAKDRFGKTGNGIGLATVKKIVERLGGSISVESERDKGAKFIFNIRK